MPSTQAPIKKRRLRNYLLDCRFQLKYTAMVVLVTVAVGAVLGFQAYQYSKGQTQALTIHLISQPNLDEAVVERIRRDAEAEDPKVLMAIVGGIGLLALALGLTGIVVTHKVVGPAYKLKRLLDEIAEGSFHVAGRLRRGDELQNLFEAFAHMVDVLRKREEHQIAELDAALEQARTAHVPQELVDRLAAMRDEKQAALD